LRALLRRPALQIGNVLRMDDLEMNTLHREVRRAGKIIDLSPREFSLLEFLLRHPNQVLTRTQILEHVWNYNYLSDNNVVDVYIGYLRRKIDRGFLTPLIHTIRGVGFRLSREGDDD
jgi:DNA-binding response OmpR family regulator